MGYYHKTYMKLLNTKMITQITFTDIESLLKQHSINFSYRNDRDKKQVLSIEQLISVKMKECAVSGHTLRQSSKELFAVIKFRTKDNELCCFNIPAKKYLK